MEMGVERAEQDVGHVERAERPLLEHRGELVAVAGAPARGVEAEEQGDHGTLRPSAGSRPSRRRPSCANSESSWSCSARTVSPPR